MRVSCVAEDSGALLSQQNRLHVLEASRRRGVLVNDSEVLAAGLQHPSEAILHGAQRFTLSRQARVGDDGADRGKVRLPGHLNVFERDLDALGAERREPGHNG